jgi:nucleoside phosphorylase
MSGSFPGDMIANQSLQHGGKTPIELGGATTPILSRNAVFNDVNPDENIPRAVFVTALAQEFLAVEKFLVDIGEETHLDGTVYGKGLFKAEERVWQVFIVEAGRGNSNAAEETRRAIGFLLPDVIFFVGIARGIKDVQIGNVVASTKIYDYDSSGDEDGVQLNQSTYDMEQMAKSVSRNWLRQVETNFDSPQAFVAPIASGRSVVRSSQSKIVRLIRRRYGDTLAVEMEGFGFLDSARKTQGLSAIVIRGISDLLDSTAEARESREIAARNASTFAFEMLAKLKRKNSVSEIDNKVYPPEIIPDINRPEKIISVVINTQSNEEYGFSIIRGRSRVEISGKVQEPTLNIPIALDTHQSAGHMTGTLDRYNELLKDESILKKDRCVVRLVLEELSKKIDFNNDEIVLEIFDNTKLSIPWELLEINRDGDFLPIGILVSTIRSFHFTQDFNYELHCCTGGIISYTNDLNHRLEDLYNCELFSCFSTFIRKIHSPESQYALISIDGFSTQEAISEDPTSTLRRSNLRYQASLVIINGQLNFGSIPLQHQIFIKLLHTSGAKGVIASLQLVQSSIGQEIINNFFDYFKTPGINNSLYIPLILKQIRQQSFEQFQISPYNPQVSALYLASFQYIYYGSPYTTLELV